MVQSRATDQLLQYLKLLLELGSKFGVQQEKKNFILFLQLRGNTGCTITPLSQMREKATYFLMACDKVTNKL